MIRPRSFLSGFRAAAMLAVTIGSVRAAPEWVEKSNTNADVLLNAIGKFEPVRASSYGLKQYDPFVPDLGPRIDERVEQALTEASGELQRRLGEETDPRVRQDLQIMIGEARLEIEGSQLERKYLLPFVAVGRSVFQSEFLLLNPETAAERHLAAVERLRRYTGLVPGTKPFTELARDRYEERASDPKLLGPYRTEVEQELANTPRYIAGLRALFTKNGLKADDALAALEEQLKAYDAWVRTTVLPRCRSDFREPPEIYAHNLRQVGLDIDPQTLIAQAQLEFAEVTAALQSLAPLVAKAHGWPETDYRAVIHRLKQDQMKREAVEPYYHNVVIPGLERMIRENHVVTLPDRPMAMRIASEAESAVQPAPHMQPPPLINNHGERGTFVLTLGNPPTESGKADSYDDFTFPAGTWTLTAHEGRPGHELQFDRMVEQGISEARAIFAFNSVNVEGWALYCETEMMPYEPIDAQMIVLQLRLLRAARAFSDPMLNLGLMTRERAHDILVNDVCLSEAFAREELDRFTFRSPGQATSYFYGFTRLMEVRTAAQISLGPKFDRFDFNNFVVSQGLLPPALLAEAVKTEFIPAHLSK